ncbi:MAG: 4Fe-4S single cluster domain-containing protein [Angustibacter sp.]
MAHRGAGLTVRLARVLAPVTVLGPGRRVAVWVQGCAIACPGCASVDTWDPDAGTEMPVEALAALVGGLATEHRADGLTITGGEPTDQSESLAELVRLVRGSHGISDVLVFTGRPSPAAWRHGPELLSAADAVVAGPYRRERPPAGRLVASDNQTIEFPQPAASERYEAWLAEPGRRLQVVVDDADVHLVGLPAAGDLDEFDRRLRDRGVVMREVSWRP